HRLVPDPSSLRRAAAPRAVAGRRAQPRGRGRHGAGSRARAGSPRRPCRRPRAARLPSPPGGARGSAAPPRPVRRGRRRLPRGSRHGGQRARAALPPVAPRRYHRGVRALTYVGPEKLEWREAPDPRVAGAAQAVVRPIAATPCDLDRAIIMGRTPAVPPFVLGHECVAEVVDVGDGVRGVAVGDRVVVPWHLCCGACDRCLRGLTAHCAAFPQYAMYGTNFGGDYGGFLADLVHVPFADAMLVPLPAGVPPERAAPASDNLTDAWLAVAGPLEKHPGGPV